MDGYWRVSKVGGRSGESYQSPEHQRDAISAWAASRGVTIDQWHSDEDVSGDVLTRPGLEVALERVRSGASGGIVVARIDRLSRAGVADALRLVEDIHTLGGSVAAIDLGLDPTTPGGELMLTLMLALARWERRRIKDTWASMRENAVRRGVPTGHPPLGYDRDDDGRLVIDDVPRFCVVATRQEVAPASVVREAYRLAGASGPHAAMEYLRENAPQRTWPDLGRVRRFLAERVFLGEVKSGDYIQTDAHEPLVPLSAWLAAQHGPSFAKQPSGDYPLSGVVRCASCDGPMTGGRCGPAVQGERPRRYKCSSRTCAAKVSIRADILEDAVFAAYRRVLAAYTEDSGDITVAGRPMDLDALRIALDRAERRLAEAMTPDVQDAAGAAWAGMVRERREAVDAAALALGQAEAVGADVVVTPAERLDAWDAATSAERRKAVAAWEPITLARGRRLTIGPGEVTLSLR